MTHPARRPARAAQYRTHATGAFAFGLVAALASGCATVRPEQRAVLADPSMRFEGEPGDKAATERVLENREASFGGGSVRGGGCGCN